MSIRLKLLITYLSVALIPAFFVGFLTFNNYRNSYEESRVSDMEDLAAFKADKIEAFFSGLRSYMETAKAFYNVKKNLPVLSRLSGSPASPEFTAARKMLDGQLQHMQSVMGLTDIMLVSPAGKVVYSSNPGHFRKEFLKPLPDPGQKAFAEGKKGTYISDVFSVKEGRPELLVTGPAADFNGVIAFEMDMEPVYKLTLDKTGFGATGELLLGKKTGDKVFYLNPLRFDPEAALKRSVVIGSSQSLPIQRAAQGQNGSGRSIDYRGREVLASWRYLPSLNWGIVTKIDTEEAFAAARNLKRLLLIILALLAVVCGVTAVSLAQSISNPIKKLSEGAKIIGSGNLDYKVGTGHKDEIGQLSRAFDEMTENLKTTTASREELRLSEERYRGLFTSMLEGFCVIEMVFDAGNKAVDYRFLEINPAFEAQTGLHNAQGRLMKELAPDHEARWFELYGKVALTGEPARFMNEAKALNRYYDVSAFRLGGAESRKVAILFSDISEAKRAEIALRGSEERLRGFYDAGMIGVIYWNMNGVIVDANNKFLEMTGYTREDLAAGRIDWGKMTPPEYSRLDEASVKELKATGSNKQPFEKEYIRKDGTRIPVLLAGAMLDQERFNGVAFVLDITRRKQLEEKTTMLAALVATSKDAIIGKDLKGTILSWNKGAEEMYGYAPEEAIGKPISMLLPPGKQDEIPWILEKIARGEKVEDFETVRMGNDGRTIQVSLAISPILDAKKAITGVSTIARDISASKKLEEDLKRSNESLEQFAYVASHDLQEPLRMMASYSELLQRRYKGKMNADADEFIEYIVDGAQRMQKLINDLLSYSRIGRGEKAVEEVDCNAVLARVLGGMRTTIEESGALVTHDPLPVLTGNEMNYIHLFQNLIGNGIKFHGAEAPRVHVKAERSGADWLFSVKDNGIGMDPQYKDRIFVIFQRLHGRGEYPGTGIGLSICKKLVELQVGRIWVESEPGKGAAFYFMIPADKGEQNG